MYPTGLDLIPLKDPDAEVCSAYGSTNVKEVRSLGCTKRQVSSTRESLRYSRRFSSTQPLERTLQRLGA